MTLEVRSRHRKALGGTTTPITIPTSHLGPIGHHEAKLSKYPIRARLSKRQADVLNLIRVKPRDLKEASEALGIGEWSIVAQVCRQLVNRGLVEEVADAATRPTWRAL